MKIGILFYSHTGHTFTLAEKLKDKLIAEGHSVVAEKLQTKQPLRMGDTKADLQFIPDIRQYNAVILGTPVRGGMPSPPMLHFLEQTASFEGKLVASFVTGFFRASWGQNQTLAQMKDICENKKAVYVGSGHVRWFSINRNQQIAELVKHFNILFPINDNCNS